MFSILRKLPKKTVDPVWRSHESGVTHLVMKSTSKEVWAAFTETCKRSHVSLRMELLNPLDYAYVGDQQLRQRVDVLRQFLDDPTERIIKDGDEMYEGPTAAFTFPRFLAVSTWKAASGGEFTVRRLALLKRYQKESRGERKSVQPHSHLE